MTDMQKDEMGLLHENRDEIVMYSTSWCPDCHRAKYLLENYGIPFINIDIDKSEGGEAFVRQVNNGNRTVPTIIFPDGTILVEPSSQMLADKAGFSLES